MASRKLPIIGSAVALLLAAGALAAKGLLEDRRHSGFPAVVYPWQSDATMLVWAVRPKDLISCRSAGYSLRRVQREHGTDVRLVVASVGADTMWVATMLREERLEASIETISEDEYRRTFGSTDTPRIYVSQQGTIISTHVLDARTAQERDSVEQVLERLIGSSSD